MLSSTKFPIAANGFEIIKVLHHSAQNDVYLAKRISDGINVVLKYSKNNLADVSNLSHEYEILKDLNNSGIPNVIDFIYAGNAAILIQEYVEGIRLKEKLINGGLPINEVLEIAIKLTDILFYLQQNKIIHKDINSKNVIISHEGIVKLLDFGISSSFNAEQYDNQTINHIEGTLTNISPEQTGRTSYSITHSSDFYSLGILLYEITVGKVPFDSTDSLEVIHFHLSKKPVSINSLVKNIPEEFNQIVSKLLEKNPDDRYQNALGLKKDLEIIQTKLKENQPIQPFKPGMYDFNEEYKQIQKLYGREAEINQVLEYFKNISESQAKMVLISGYSGVGKSSLIKHVKFPIIQQHGNFISGKFEQFKKDIPYYAFIEAIKEFIKNLLTEPESKINVWKQRLLRVLGENAGLITEVIPQLTMIIGKTNPVVKLQPAEQETRFHMVLLDFIYALSTASSPLVIFIDDLQWADFSSLSLVKRILENPRQDSILILGAFRDNEVLKGHPLLLTLKQIAEKKVRIIELKALDENTTRQIVSDSFGISIEKSEQLSKHVFNKTKGNPFFIHRFLKSLFTNKLIKKNSEDNWIWNAKEIEELGYTDNVIDLMTEGLTTLSQETQKTLKYAAAIGNTFDLKDLAEISEQSQIKTYELLKQGINNGYLYATDRNYRFISVIESYEIEKLDANKNNIIAQFSFSHDKVQQAAYGLIAKEDLEHVHLQIGRMLLKNKNEEQLQDTIFELLNHFVLSIQLITDNEEKIRLIELCLEAGKKAKDSNSYILGIRYLNLAKSLLNYDSWINNYYLTFNILFELGESEYLNGNARKAEQLFKEVLSYAKTNFEKLKVYYVHSSLFLKQGNTTESLKLGLEAVKLYGINFPTNKSFIKIASLFTIIKYLFLFSTKYQKTEKLYSIKDCTDEEIIALNKFLIDLATSAYQQDQNLMMLVTFKIVKSFVKNGFSDASGWGYSGFSVVVLSALKIPTRGFKLWDLTINLHQRTMAPLIKWRLKYTVVAFHNHWRIANNENFESIQEVIKACVINGDQIFTNYAVGLLIRVQLNSGVKLKEIVAASEDHLALIKNSEGGNDFFNCFYQVTKSLNGLTNGDSWDDESFSGNETLERMQKEGNLTKLAFFHSAKCFHLFVFSHYLEALNESQIVEKYASNFLGDILQSNQSLYSILSIAACFGQLNASDQKKYKPIIKSKIKEMNMWAKYCPENYNTHLFLMQAEQFAINGKFEEAITHFEKAINWATAQNQLHLIAISNERAAAICSNRNFVKQSHLYIKEAYDAYQAWGAFEKCKQIMKTYPSVFGYKNGEQNVYANPSNESTTISTFDNLDIKTLMKASQSIASQVKYVDLLKKLLQITIENAGANKGCILLLKNDQLCIEAQSHSSSNQIEIVPSIPFIDTELVPHSIINYCWRSLENVVINDAMQDELYNSDSYVIKNKIHSMMCIPITTQGTTIGLVYLENSLLKGVFYESRLALLKMLSSQIGISIQNAMLYENLEDKVLERTKELEEQKVQLNIEKGKSDDLLLNILPRKTAEELKSTGKSKAQNHKNVSVLFSDIVDFTQLAEKLTAEQLVFDLNELFSGMDDIITRYGIEKIKTIGDAYMCANGIEEIGERISAEIMLDAALEIIEFVKNLNQQKRKSNRTTFEIRIGLHYGTITAGVVGKTKFAYDIWGDTVNMAARMEQKSTAGRININNTIYELLKDNFICESRGKIETKNKGNVEMYYVNGKK